MCLTCSYVFNVFAHAYDQPRAGQENPPTEENLGVCLCMFRRRECVSESHDSHDSHDES